MGSRVLRKTEVPGVILNAFPEYRGRRFEVGISEKFSIRNTAWNGGSRTTYRLVNLITGEIGCLSEIVKDPLRFNGIDDIPIPKDIVVVRNIISCGKDLGIFITIRPENVNHLVIEKEVDLTNDEIMVLRSTSMYKSSYMGIKNYRFYEAKRQFGISKAIWEEAKMNLIDLGFLTKRGALTVKGKNSV